MYSERSNKAALLMAKRAYNQQLATFVGDSEVRYASRMVQQEIDEIVAIACEETGADPAWVGERLRLVLADEAIAVKNVDKAPGVEGIKHTEVGDAGEVEGAGLEDSLDNIKHVDPVPSAEKKSNLDDTETWKPCFRCGEKLNPVVAAVTPVCKDCTEKIATGDFFGGGEPYPKDTWDPSEDNSVPEFDPKAEFQCKLCKNDGLTFEGSRDEVISHIQSSHAHVVNNQNPTVAATKEAAPGPVQDPAPVEVAPQATTPADRFDSLIQELADNAAAHQFSSADDKNIKSIASQLGLDEEEVRKSVFVTATFGNSTAANGRAGESEVPDGYEEVQLDDQGGRVESHEAIVPVNMIISRVAQDMKMTDDLVYNMVKDRYGGAELPDKYHAAVSGEHHYYLPSEMVAGATGPSASPEPPQQMTDPTQAPQQPLPQQGQQPYPVQ